MKKYILIVVILTLVSKVHSQSDTLDMMESLIRNVFEAKTKLEGGEFLVKRGTSEYPFQAKDVQKLFTDQGISTNIDSLSERYDFHVKQIKEHRFEFLAYYYRYAPHLGQRPYLSYIFLEPYSSLLPPRPHLSYRDAVEVVKYFLIDLDRHRLPSSSEVDTYLDNVKETKSNYFLPTTK